MRLALAVFLLTFVPTLPVVAQEIPKSVVDAVGRDLAELQKIVLEAQRQSSEPDVVALGKKVITITQPTDLKAGMNDEYPSVERVDAGRMFRVVGETPGWYAVETDKPHHGSKTAWVKETSAAPEFRLTTTPLNSQTLGDALFSKLTEQAAKMKQAYQDNPYISITGFSVNVAPPSVSVNFEFKKTSP